MDSQSHDTVVTSFFFNIWSEKTTAHNVSHYLLNMHSETQSFILLKVLKQLDTLQKRLKLLQFVSLLSIACNLHAFCFILFITFLMTNTIVTSPKNHCQFTPERLSHCMGKISYKTWISYGKLVTTPLSTQPSSITIKEYEQQQMRKENAEFSD